MKRNIEPEFEFQKYNFINLWKKAIGNRSYSSFGKEAGISFGYISKYMNLRCDVAPTIPTIKKIANATKDVTYAELLEAAGYDPEIHDDALLNPITHKEITIANRLLASLASVKFAWKFENSILRSNVPISITLDNAPFNKWYFIPIVKENISKEDITTALGSREAEMIESGEKVSFIATKKEIVEELKNMQFNFLLLRMSVIYAPKDEVLLANEYYLKTAITITDIDEQIVIDSKNANVEELFVI